MKKSRIPEKPNAKKDTFSFEHNGVELSFIIQDPTFDILATANGAMIGLSGGINFAKAGKVIWDTCCLEFSPEIEETPQLLIGICTKLVENYLTGFDVDIKKK